MNLLNYAGDPWKNHDKLKTLIKKVSDKCQICEYVGVGGGGGGGGGGGWGGGGGGPPPTPRPLVGLLMTTTFQECVAMDLKFYKGNIRLQLVDHATRLSSSKII